MKSVADLDAVRSETLAEITQGIDERARVRSETERMRTHSAEAEVKLNELDADIAERMESIAKADAELASLRTAIQSSRDELSAGYAETSVAASTPASGETAAVIQPLVSTPVVVTTGDARDLRDVPGLAGADVETLQALSTALADGVCATDALRDVLGFINRQTLVHLIRVYGAC